MAKLTILGRDFDIAPYKIAQMRRAAPLIDKINATAGASSTMEGLAAAASHFVAALSIGLVKIDETLTPEYLDENLTMGDMPALRDCFLQIMQESGLSTAGEATAPAAPEAAGASTISSETSSTD